MTLPIVVSLALVGIKTVVYGVLLWILVRLQGMQHTFAGLLLCSLVASVICLIPIAGPYLAYAALLLCLRKVTHEAIYPDCVFTAVIANSIMFVLGLWLAGGVISRLGGEETVEARSDEAGTAAAPAQPEPKAINSQSSSNRPMPLLERFTGKRSGLGSSAGLSLKGVLVTSSGQCAMLSLDRSYQTVKTGESVILRGPDGPVTVRCDQITKSFVVLTVNGTPNVRLNMP